MSKGSWWWYESGDLDEHEAFEPLCTDLEQAEEQKAEEGSKKTVQDHPQETGEGQKGQDESPTLSEHNGEDETDKGADADPDPEEPNLPTTSQWEKEMWFNSQKEATVGLKAQLELEESLLLKALKLREPKNKNKQANRNKTTQAAAAAAAAAAESEDEPKVEAAAATTEDQDEEQEAWNVAKQEVKRVLKVVNELIAADEQMLVRCLKTCKLSKEHRTSLLSQAEKAVFELGNKEAVVQAQRAVAAKRRKEVEEREQLVAKQQKEVELRTEQRKGAYDKRAIARTENRVLGAQQMLERLKTDLEIAKLASEHADKVVAGLEEDAKDKPEPEEEDNDDDEDDCEQDEKSVQKDEVLKYELVVISMLKAHLTIQNAVLCHKRVVKAQEQLRQLVAEKATSTENGCTPKYEAAKKEALKQARATMAPALQKVKQSSAVAASTVDAFACSATKCELTARLAVLRYGEEQQKDQRALRYIVNDLKREYITEKTVRASIQKCREELLLSEDDPQLAEHKAKLEVTQKRLESLRNSYVAKNLKLKSTEMRVAQLEAAITSSASQEKQVKRSKTTTTDESFMVDESGRLMRVVTTTVVLTTVVITPADDGNT